MLQKFYYFIFPFLSPLSSFFLFSSLSLSGSLSLLPILVPSLFDQSGMFTISDDGVAPTTTARSATLDLAPTTRSHPCSATFDLADLTPRPPSISRSSHSASLWLWPFLFYLFIFFVAIWVDLMVVVGCGLWAVTVAVVVGCGGDGPLLFV